MPPLAANTAKSPRFEAGILTDGRGGFEIAVLVANSADENDRVISLHIDLIEADLAEDVLHRVSLTHNGHAPAGPTLGRGSWPGARSLAPVAASGGMNASTFPRPAEAKVSGAVVCGINWGDEGKGRVVDYLATDFDIVVRYQGGNNAGHTVVNEFGSFKLNLIPSGIFYPRVVNVLGPGMVVDLEGLASEIARLDARGIRCDNLRVSDRATIVFPFHRQEDAWEEERLRKNAYGSTRRGIAPAYGDRYLKKAIQIGELLHPRHFRERLSHLIEWKSLVARQVYGVAQPLSVDSMYDWAMSHGEKVRPLICDTSSVLEDAQKSGRRILFEAQLGALRDVMFGIYPFTTSSSTLASFAPIGSGLLGARIDRVIGSMKAFSTCVGAGPFVTELFDERASRLRESAQEYGAATGRPRRIGHFDALASRYGVMLQAATEIVLTKLDSLSGFGPLHICTHYQVDGKPLHSFPINPLLEQAKPVLQEMKGWDEDITSVRDFDKLPQAARDYVLEIERMIACPIRYVSVGPERQQMIVR